MKTVIFTTLAVAIGLYLATPETAWNQLSQTSDQHHSDTILTRLEPSEPQSRQLDTQLAQKSGPFADQTTAQPTGQARLPEKPTDKYGNYQLDPVSIGSDLDPEASHPSDGFQEIGDFADPDNLDTAAPVPPRSLGELLEPGR
ncbi:MAG: hypothetical protein AAF541_06245 [Pseudomonadota bacterium]